MSLSSSWKSNIPPAKIHHTQTAMEVSKGDYFTLFFPSVPDAPMMANINSVATTSASIMWEPPISVTQTPLSIIVFYQLILSEGKFNTPDQYINTTSISYTFTGLEEFNTYSCRVAAINGVGRGQFGSPINFTTLEAGNQIFYSYAT